MKPRQVCLDLVLASLLTWTAKALLFFEREQWADADISEWAEGASEANTASEFSVNKVETLQDKFSALLEQDQPFMRAENKQSLKIVIGVFTTLSPRDRDIRQVLRRTWMTHPDVCTLEKASDECAVRVVFVAARRDNKRAKDDTSVRYMVNEPDVLILDMDENMDEGKSHAWFAVASKHFPWADFIAKCDNDAYLHVKSIVDHLPATDECEAYLGKPWTCLRGGMCPYRSCGPPVGHNFSMYKDEYNRTDCWSYMQGGFYAMSRRMAFSITRPEGWLTKNSIGPEDLQTGFAVTRYVRATGKCIYVWNASEVVDDRMYYHLRGQNEHPGRVSEAWDQYYGYARNAISKDNKHEYYTELKLAYKRLMKGDELGPSNKCRRSPKRGSTRVALAVFSGLTDWDRDMRSVIRSTWMSHPDVCTIGQMTDNCTVRIVFVTSDTKAIEELPESQRALSSGGMMFLASEPDLLLLDAGDKATSFAWFEVAERQFDWADYIGKADADIFLHVTNIIDALPVGVTGYQGAYLGKPWACLEAHCPPSWCGPPAGNNFTAFNQTKGQPDCWAFMGSSFYILSRSLLPGVLAHAEAARESAVHDAAETRKAVTDTVARDAVETGRAVTDYARQSGKSVYTWTSSDVVFDRMYHRFARSIKPNEYPIEVSEAWDKYYHGHDHDMKKFESFLAQSMIPGENLMRRSLSVAPKKVVVGIFTTVGYRDRLIRHRLRNSWLRHPDVCMISNITEACAVHVVFVASQAQKPGHAGPTFLDYDPDVLLMDREHDDGNKGKTFAWLQLASRHYAWADFVAKVDPDVYVRVANVLDALPETQGCEAYLGYPATCNENGCPPPSCGPPAGHDFVSLDEGGGQCWTYMRGGFYAMSRALALAITEPGGWLEKNQIGPESLQSGLAVHNYVKQTGRCVRIWNNSEVILNRMYIQMHPERFPRKRQTAAWHQFYATKDVHLDLQNLTFQSLLKRDHDTYSTPSRGGQKKVLVGVFTHFSERSTAYRDLLRNTWMQQAGVCIYPKMGDECVIVAMFVACAKRLREDAASPVFDPNEPDMLILNMYDSDVNGKSFEWFKLAATHFAWADYVARAKEDTYLHVGRLLDALPQDECSQAYLGKPWTCAIKNCPPLSCGPPVKRSILLYNDPTNRTDCWSFMDGGFYALSRSLMVDITLPDGFYEKNKKGLENLQVGLAVTEYARRTGKCVRVWDAAEIGSDSIFYNPESNGHYLTEISDAWRPYVASS